LTVSIRRKRGRGAQSWIGVSRPLLAAGYRGHAPDQRGCTRHARPRSRRAYRLNELVEDVVALVDAAGVDRVHLVGHDWGGGVAWMLLQAWHVAEVDKLNMGTPRGLTIGGS